MFIKRFKITKIRKPLLRSILFKSIAFYSMICYYNSHRIIPKLTSLIKIWYIKYIDFIFYMDRKNIFIWIYKIYHNSPRCWLYISLWTFDSWYMCPIQGTHLCDEILGKAISTRSWISGVDLGESRIREFLELLSAKKKRRKERRKGRIRRNCRRGRSSGRLRRSERLEWKVHWMKARGSPSDEWIRLRSPVICALPHLHAN